MESGFALILTLLVLITGMIALIDVLFFASKRKQAGIKKVFWVVEYSRSLFPILLLVLFIRSFVIQPYRVPSGSLEPTVLPGDFIVVNQFAYGLRLPVIHTKILNIGEPKRGDIALFRFPRNPHVIYVKRVIGLPGDHIVYANKVLTINGKVMQQKDLGPGLDKIENGTVLAALKKQENLDGIKHQIYVLPDSGNGKKIEVTVPKDHYFMMGDNRDLSDDSRDWGFVPEANLVGKAMFIWFSWDSDSNHVRWWRIGHKIS